MVLDKIRKFNDQVIWNRVAALFVLPSLLLLVTWEEKKKPIEKE